ncbi:ParB/RepB/Spo0J family partition protein [Clostridium cellulovorans]|uniref:ParB-like partition protein n=1 Tax=Clostridium cellulovorans (strain ATCC 35296 / DSM 3052 / OCM 3 / 743B) TaxID=573061 RepID=D9SPD0_CLOC7|nr:ParB/RepB/Spo0J family partition protein [Clostridium cellulovorans]ADL54032.1 parB-like partition protein [Clostridium cellulovorans 743B]
MSRKRGLGKGLGALIPEEEIIDEVSNSKTVNLIGINKIKANSEQPRKSFDDEKIGELAKSIKEYGVIQPLVLKQNFDGTYTIVAGERRWRACKLAAIKEVPAVIMDLDDKSVLEVSLIENIQREDLNPIEEAIAYKKLLNDFDLTQEQLSERIGKSRTAISNIMRLLALDVRVQEYLMEGIISEGHGRAILGIEDLNKQYELAQMIIDKRLSVREIENIIKDFKTKKEEVEIEKNYEKNPHIKDLEGRLQNYFDTKVAITNKKDNKGKIEIQYYSLEDLDRLLELLHLTE